MKPIPDEIIGKRLSSVMIREPEDGRPPAAQLFLCFDDGTSMEFWADGTIHPAGGVDSDSEGDIERKGRPGVRTVARAGGRLAMSDGEAARLAQVLVNIQEGIVSVLESLSADYTGEARGEIGRVERVIENGQLPDFIRVPLLEACNRATDAISGLTRNTGLSARVLVEERKRLANELAYIKAEAPPYPEDGFPRYSQTVTQ